ncbi:unnamed protein product [Leptidea sinapis]|uniref:Uncharacterized protein n=1 Tax=Leptidea sinapis TaxID=189913 RepID=A0A5E4PPM4_9NEOP|nr:unnamed protein product [Leptidea sinapis]
MRKVIVTFIFTLIININCFKILVVIPMPAISHQSVFRPLTQDLAKRGHKVTVITAYPAFAKDNCPKNLKEIDVHDVSCNLWRKNTINDYEFGKRENIIDQSYDILKVVTNTVALQLKVKEIQDLITNHEIDFDLLLIESCTRAALVYSDIFKVPVVQISSFGMWLGVDENMGAPSHPILYPNTFHQIMYNMSLWEKLYELYKHWLIKMNFDAMESMEIATLQNILAIKLPNYNVLKNNVDMSFINTHPLWIDNQPLPINIISTWGMHKKPQKELPQDLKTYLDSSTRGVIYVSFGSITLSSNLPPEKVEIFTRVFAQLQCDILWKWETDELPGKSPNIKISKWFPQSDLLQHPNIKLFITQGGLQSLEEAINAGVPLIGIPVYADQWYNVEKIVHRKIGIQLEFPELQEEHLKRAIETLLNDTSYRQNVLKLRRIMSDQLQNSLDRAVWWIEHVGRQDGSKYLRAPAANMSWIEYYDVQLVLIMITCIAVLILVFRLLLNMFWSLLTITINLEMLKLIVTVICAVIININCFKILAVIPIPAISHQSVFRPLTQELAKRGHKVTVITAYPAFSKDNCPKNLKEIDVHDVSCNLWRKNTINDYEFGKRENIIDQTYDLLKVQTKTVTLQLKIKEIQDLITNHEIDFDLLLIESCTRAALVYSDIFKVPVVQISSFGMWLGVDENMGAPSHPILYPNIFHQTMYNMSLWEKLNELYKHWFIKMNYDGLESMEIATIQNILEKKLPNYNVLKNNVDMSFINIHPLWIDNQPLPINVISTWGMHKKIQKELPQDLKTYLDSSTRGVIYMSFGSSALSSNLPPEKVEIFTRVFAQLQCDILWKWETDELPGKPPNIKISKWFPQSDLYRQNVLKLRRIMSDQLQNSLDRAVWWIEHVGRQDGAKYLRAPAANMSWIEYYDVQLVLILIACIAVLILLFRLLTEDSRVLD